MVSYQIGGETEGNFDQIIIIIIIITIIAILKAGHLTDWQRSRRQVWQVRDSRLFHPAMTFHPMSDAELSYLI